jgi:hypothetical protein
LIFSSFGFPHTQRALEKEKTDQVLTRDGPKPVLSIGIIGTRVRRSLDPRQMWKKTLEVTVLALIKGGGIVTLSALTSIASSV